MKQIELARALGLSAARISQLKAQGMPVTSPEAAAAWCGLNLDIARRIGYECSPLNLDRDAAAAATGESLAGAPATLDKIYLLLRVVLRELRDWRDQCR